MSLSEFLKLMASTLIFVAIILFWLLRSESMSTYMDISIIAVVFFLILSFIIFFYGNAAIKSANKHMYSQVILINFGIKLFFSIIILIAYHQVAQPPNKFFIVPFGIVYLAFTVFETYFMTRQSKLS